MSYLFPPSNFNSHDFPLPYRFNRKRYGDNGKPFLSSLEGLKNLELEPLIKTTKEEDVTQPIIHLTKGRSNPI
jgi:hypothetical protein